MDPHEKLEVSQSETLQQISGELPQGNVNIAPAQTVEEVLAAPLDESNVFEVDGQKFASEKAAFDYLKARNSELEATSMVEMARLEGMQDALRYGAQPQGGVPQQEVVNPELDAENFYANPIEYLAKERAKMKNELMSEVSASQATSQRNAQIWNDFVTRHPSLADMRDIVDLVADQNSKVVKAMAARNPEKAYDFVASKVKAKFQKYSEDMKPGRVLTENKGGVSPGSNQIVTTAGKQGNNDKAVDFISQMRNLKR